MGSDKSLVRAITAFSANVMRGPSPAWRNADRPSNSGNGRGGRDSSLPVRRYFVHSESRFERGSNLVDIKQHRPPPRRDARGKPDGGGTSPVLVGQPARASAKFITRVRTTRWRGSRLPGMSLVRLQRDDGGVTRNPECREMRPYGVGNVAGRKMGVVLFRHPRVGVA